MLARWPPLTPGLYFISLATPEKDFSKNPDLFSLTNHCGPRMGHTDWLGLGHVLTPGATDWIRSRRTTWTERGGGEVSQKNNRRDR